MSEPFALDRLFRCPRYGYLAMAACLRRTVDRVRPREGERAPGAIIRPGCAVCDIGREHTRQAQLVGIGVGPCERCGAALIGRDIGCPSCEARRAKSAASLSGPVAAGFIDEPQGVEGAISAAYDRADRERRDLLDALVKRGGKCRYCGSKLTDTTLALHPEVCGTRACEARARRDGFVSDLPTGDALAAGTIEPSQPEEQPTCKWLAPGSTPASPSARPFTKGDADGESRPEVHAVQEGVPAGNRARPASDAVPALPQGPLLAVPGCEPEPVDRPAGEKAPQVGGEARDENPQGGLTEGIMPKGRPSGGPCRECGATGTRHREGCAKHAGAVIDVPVTRKKAAAAVPIGRKVAGPIADHIVLPAHLADKLRENWATTEGGFDPTKLSDPQLLACVEEIDRRAKELEDRAGKLRQARQAIQGAA